MKHLAALLLTILVGAVAIAPAQAHDRTIPPTVLLAAKIAVNSEFDYGTCRFTNFRHHIRCDVEQDEYDVVVMFHRVGYSRYQLVASVMGVVIVRDYMNL